MLPRHFKVLVTTDEKTAAQQIHAALAEALSEEKIGIHMPRRSERGRIMVTHLDALKDFVQGDLAYGGYALREFDAWICDEVHRLPAPSRIPFLNQFRPTYCWGLTATPVRADNSHELNSVVFGPALLAKSSDGTLEIQAGAGEKGIVPLRVFVFPLLTPRPLAEDLSLYELTRAAYLKNPALGATLKGINSNLPEAAKVLVCADTVRLGIILRRQLPQYTFVHRRQQPEYRQDVLKRLRAGEIRRVLCADIWSEGIDVPDLDYVIDCSAKPLPQPDHSTRRTRKPQCRRPAPRPLPDAALSGIPAPVQSRGEQAAKHERPGVGGQLHVPQGGGRSSPLRTGAAPAGTGGLSQQARPKNVSPP